MRLGTNAPILVNMSPLADMTEDHITQSQLYYEGLSLYVCNSSTYCAQLSCGGVVDTCLAVARGEIEKGFAIVRPPGHHAEPDEHMGFCFFNNVCVAARVVQRETDIKKILILDWCEGSLANEMFTDGRSFHRDIHHGKLDAFRMLVATNYLRQRHAIRLL